MNTLTAHIPASLDLAKTNAVKMTSLQIAELVGKRHDNVKRTIETLAEQGVIGFPQIEEIPAGEKGGRPGTVYVFDLAHKRDSFVVVAQLSPEFTAKLVDEWQRLEAIFAGQTPVIPQTLPEALRLAAEAIEERDRLALENQAKAEALAIAAPKAQALDRIASPTEGAVCLRVAAKLLQMPEKQFLQFASAEGFVFRNHHSRIWQGYAEKARAGLVELKLTTIERDDGSTKTVEQVLITRAGLAKLAERLERRNKCPRKNPEASTATAATASLH